MSDVKWIKIRTNIFEDEKIMLIEGLPKADSILIIWFKLLCLAGKTNNDGIFMLNEEIPYTNEMLSKIFRRKKSLVDEALKTFQKFGMIEIVDGVTTIPKWNEHQSLQGFDKKKEYMREYMKEYRSKQNVKLTKANSKANVSSIEEEEEEDKNKKNNIFSPPTVEEVRAYCQERNNGIDAEAFISFYESKGWMIGKNKMKDWKAAVRTWERSRKEEKKNEKPKFDSFSQRDYDFAELERIANGN